MSTFNLTAQINLRGPANIKPIVSKIQREISAAKIRLNLDVNQNAAKNITSITTRLNNLSKAAISANTNISNLNQSLTSLANSFNSINSSTTSSVNNLAKTTRAASSAGKALSETRTQVEEFGKQAGLAVKRFAAFTTVTAPIYALTNAITNGFKEFVNFNKEIVRLSQVTGQSVGDLGAVSKEITRLSTSLGVASSDLLQVATTLAQAGFSAEDTKIALEALAKSALAPSFESLTDTTEGAIAAIRQFGLQAGELDGALGSINAVAAAFAVEAGDIITAIQRTGGVFSAASRGVSEGSEALNEFIAIFTSVRATTRESAETIATGLRTIFTRIQRTKTIEQLREFGIELQDLEGKFVGPFEATKRLSEGLNRIDPRSADFAAISEELGGFRQIGKVIPLIQQFATAEEALAVAQKGTKSTSKDAIIAQQSLAVQFEKTRQNFLALIRELGESTTFKNFAGLSLLLADSFVNLARSLKPLLPLLLTFASIKAGSALTEYVSGFGKGLFGGRGGGPSGGSPTVGGGPSSGTGGGSTSLASNTASLNTLSGSIITLNQSILALNQNIVNNNSLLMNRPAGGKFASGGLVPGSGNSDTYRAMLTPGEFVIRKKAVEKIGVENLARMNSGGRVQKFVRGGEIEKEILSNTIQNTAEGQKRYQFGLVGLRSGTKESQSRTESFTVNTGGINKAVDLHIRTLSETFNKTFSKNIEKHITGQLKTIITDTADNLRSKLGGQKLTAQTQKQILSGSTLSSAVGSIFESSLGLLGSPYVEKTEKTKAIDFPKGLGVVANKFNISPNIPTDVTRTVGGRGKGLSDMKGQIKRFLKAIDRNEFTKAADKLAGKKAMAQLNKSDILSNIFDKIPPSFNRSEAGRKLKEKYGLRQRGALNPKSLPTTLETLSEQGQEKQFLADLRSAIGLFPKLEILRQHNGGKTKGFSSGGSSEDTVHALLTPGEFVINKETAQRIGYGTLNRLNKADKLPGFNKGGLVGPQKFAIGGAVESIGGVPGVIAAITAVILPQIEQLANSFGKLNGTIGVFGSTLGGAIREASGLTLSAGIGLRAVGADEKTIGRSLAGAAIGGAIGGALTEGTGKALERALTQNTSKFSNFDKVLRDLSEAPTEELRLEAAKDLQKSFMELDSSVQSSITSIDNLERLNNLGNAIKDVTLTILTGVTAISALSQAATAAKLALDNRTLATLAPGVSGPQPAPLPIATTLLGKFAGMIPVVGNIITGITVATQLFGAFNNSLKKSTEQLDRVYKNLYENTKNNPAFGPTSPNLQNILDLAKAVREQGLSSEGQKRAFGTIGTNNDLNELNLTFRTLLTSRLAKESIPFGDTESMKDLTTKLGNDTEKFNKIFKETSDEFIKLQFIRSQTATGEVTTEEAERKFTKLIRSNPEEVRRIAEEFTGAQNREIIALKELTKRNNEFRLSLLSVDNILVKFASSLELISNKTLSDFDNLDRELSLLRGEPIAPGGQALRQQAEVLKNLRGAEQPQIEEAISTVGQLLRPTSKKEQEIFGKMSAQIRAQSVIEKELPVILRSIQAEPSQRSGKSFSELLEDRLGDQITTAVGGNTKLASEIFKELGDNIQNNIDSGKEAVDGLIELARNNSAVSALLKSSELTQKTYIEVLETSAKVQDKLAESSKKYLDIQNQLIQSTTQRLQSESQEGNELNRILGKEVSLSDLNKSFDVGIKQLTRDIPGGGTTNPEIISRELKIARDRIGKIEEEISANIGDAIKQSELRSQLDVQASKFARFNKALVDLATSGEKTKNALDKIAEAQNKFKSRRQLLADLLIGAQNPETAERQRQIFESIEAARSGRFSNEQQAALFINEGTKILEAMGVQESVISSLFNRAMGRNGLLMNAVARTPEEKAALDRVLSFLKSEGMSNEDRLARILPKIFSPLISFFAGDKAPLAALNTAQIERERAGKGVEDSFNEQLKLVTNGTISIYEEYNKKLQGILTKNINDVIAIEDRVNASRQLSNQPKTVSPPVRGLSTEFKGLTNSLGRFYMDTIRQAPQVREKMDSYQSEFGKAKSFQEQLQLLDKLEKDYAERLTVKDKDGRESIPLSRMGLIQEFVKETAKFRKLLEEAGTPPAVTSSSRASFLQQQRPNPPQLNDGAFLQFNQSIEKFNNTGGNLIQPMSDLSQSMVVFKESSNKLTRALDAFATKFSEEMKASISHTYDGNVNLTFNDTLDVNLRNNNPKDSQLVQNVYDKLVPYIKSEINKLRYT